jgi:single-strand DNA-binding protein
MPNLNKVMLMGNLTRDPEVRYTPKGTAVAEIGMAINRRYSTDSGEQKEEVTYVDVELWGRQAEIAKEYLSKGRPVYIEGRLKLDSWEDKQTGQKRSKMRVVGENMQMLGGRDGGGGGGGRDGGYGEESGGAGGGGFRRSAPQQGRPIQRPPVDQDLDGEPDDVPF